MAWWQRRSAQETATSSGHYERSDPGRSEAGWREVPALQRTVGELAPLVPLQAFTAGLSAHQNPSFLGPLGHVIDPDGPSGRVQAVVAPLASVEHSTSTELVLAHRSGNDHRRTGLGAVQRLVASTDSELRPTVAGGTASAPVAPDGLVAADATDARNALVAPDAPHVSNAPDAPHVSDAPLESLRRLESVAPPAIAVQFSSAPPVQTNRMLPVVARSTMAPAAQRSSEPNDLPATPAAVPETVESAPPVSSDDAGTATAPEATSVVDRAVDVPAAIETASERPQLASEHLPVVSRIRGLDAVPETPEGGVLSGSISSQVESEPLLPRPAARPEVPLLGESAPPTLGFQVNPVSAVNPVKVTGVEIPTSPGVQRAATDTATRVTGNVPTPTAPDRAASRRVGLGPPISAPLDVQRISPMPAPTGQHPSAEVHLVTSVPESRRTTQQTTSADPLTLTRPTPPAPTLQRSLESVLNVDAEPPEPLSLGDRPATSQAPDVPILDLPAGKPAPVLPVAPLLGRPDAWFATSTGTAQQTHVAAGGPKVQRMIAPTAATSSALPGTPFTPTSPATPHETGSLQETGSLHGTGSPAGTGLAYETRQRSVAPDVQGSTAPQGTSTAPHGMSTTPHGTSTTPQGTSTTPLGMRAMPLQRMFDPGSAAILAGIAQRDEDGSVVFDPPRYADSRDVTAPAVQRVQETAPVEPTVQPADAPSAAAGKAAMPGQTAAVDIEDLARRLFDPLSARLKSELRLDRERAGLVTDLRR
jgi:hypothetical protein